jgi:hypothetical protein
MHYDIIEARHIRDYVVWFRFRDGTEGELDLANSLRGPVFEPLRDQRRFRDFRVHPELHTITWPNGADLAPDALHDRVRSVATR